MNELVYNVNAAAAMAHEAPLNKELQQIKVVWGGLGTGKSTWAAWEWFLMCLKADGPLYGAVIRGSYRELMDSTKKLIEKWFGDFITWREGDEEFFFDVPNEKGEVLRHTLALRSAQRAAHTQKFQSAEYNFVWMEEAVPTYNVSGIVGSGLPEEIVGIALGRLRLLTAKDQERKLVITANPPFKSHWLCKHFIELSAEQHKARNMVVVWTPPGENKANLPKDYYGPLRLFMDEDTMRRFVNGEIVAAFDGEKVFPEARDQYHVVKGPLKINQEIPLILGHDFGLNPATLITQITPMGQWVWLDELVMFNRSIEDHFEELKIKLSQEPYSGMKYRSWGDPAGLSRNPNDAKTAFEVALAHGFEIRPGKQVWQARREAMKQRLTRTASKGMPALIVDRLRCDWAATALLGGYRYPKNASGHVLNSGPPKGPYSHVADAAQYIATGEFDILQNRAQVEDLESQFYLLPKFDPLKSHTPRRSTPPSWICS